jgi:hypothetical protein
MQKAPTGFVVALMNSVAEVTMDFMARLMPINMGPNTTLLS